MGYPGSATGLVKGSLGRSRVTQAVSAYHFIVKRCELPDRYFVHTFQNGLTLLAEQMPGTQSAAMTLLIPAGSAGDPPDASGTAPIVADLILATTVR